MIDRFMRDRLALALRRFAIGRASQMHLDIAMENGGPSADRGVVEVSEDIYWSFLNLGPKRLVGRHAISRTRRREVARTVLFLRSNEEFLWPVRTSRVPFLLGVVTFGRTWRTERAKWRQAGEVDCYPFLDRAQLARAKARFPFGPAV